MLIIIACALANRETKGERFAKKSNHGAQHPGHQQQQCHNLRDSQLVMKHKGTMQLSVHSKTIFAMNYNNVTIIKKKMY